MHTRVSTSLQVYRAHIVRRDDGTLDASGVISRECYLDWLASKNCPESDLEAKKYHRTLTNHVSGIDGRSPFFPDEEAAILMLFRRKLPWPCFPKHLAAVGQRYRARGYHEKKNDRVNAPTPAPTPANSPPIASSSSSSAIIPIPTPTPSLPAAVADASSSMELAASASAATVEQPQPAAACECCSDRAKEILETLPTSDASYLKSLGTSVVRNYGSPKFSITEWTTINAILRFMILGKTARCCAHVDCPMVAAQELCQQFSLREQGGVVMVFDMTAKVYGERALAQNEKSVELFGQLVGNPKGTITEGSELFEVVTAVGAAYHKPGTRMHLRQKMRFQDGRIQFFDMDYYVCPESFFMVICGKPAAAGGETIPGGSGSVDYLMDAPIAFSPDFSVTTASPFSVPPPLVIDPDTEADSNDDDNDALALATPSSSSLTCFDQLQQQVEDLTLTEIDMMW